MNLHPDERPQTIEIFRQALIGERTVIPQSFTRPRPLSFRDLLRANPEKYLFLAAAGLLLVSLIATITH
jgi:hypothetical protein